MKVAITSSGSDLQSKIDRRFGRCKYFVIYDTITKSLEFIPNPNINAEEGAGPASVKIIAEKEVGKVISGEFGIKIKPLLDSLKIQMISFKDTDKSIQEIISLLDS
jgi:predicted Fe-Mo cluster-binding NifX family protein